MIQPACDTLIGVVMIVEEGELLSVLWLQLA